MVRSEGKEGGLTGLIVALALLVIGAGQIVAGVFILLGSGWGLIALGIATVSFGIIASRGTV